MKLKLFHKLSIALFACTALVLLIVIMVTRASIGRGFVDFLQQQERNEVQQLVPELAEWYRQRDSWDGFYDHPRDFYELVFKSMLRGSEGQFGFEIEGRPGLVRGGRRGSGPPGSKQGGAGPVGPGPGPGRRNALPQRIFLLDSDKALIIGSIPIGYDMDLLMPVEVDGVTAGWLGYALIRNIKLPEEEAFIIQLRQSLLIGLALGLVMAALLAWVLARHLSRPVNKMAGGIRALAAGNYDTRLEIHGSDEIAKLGEDVNRLSSALREHETARKRWMSDIAHELRTPLAIIHGELEAMRDGVRPLDIQQLASVREEVNHLTSLVDDLHKLTLTDSGSLAYKMGELDINELVHFSVDSFRSNAHARNLTLEYSGPQQPVILRGDEQRLRQLLHNLLDNSVSYTDRDGSISVELNRSEGEVELVINDSAPGASADECKRLFERLYRMEASRNRNSGGSGLGLAICKNIVEAHGGTIKAEPGAQGGLQITTTLPLSS